MASMNLSSFFFFFVLLIFLLPYAVNCDEDEDDLLKAINKYRSESHHLPQLKSNSRANCLATRIARNLSDTPCNCANVASQQHQFVTDKFLEKCCIVANSTKEGAIMPVCMQTEETQLLLENYTQNQQYSKYLNCSKYVGAGLGCKGNWKVVVLTTNTTGGRFVARGAAASLLVSKIRSGRYSLLFLMLLGSLLY